MLKMWRYWCCEAKFQIIQNNEMDNNITFQIVDPNDSKITELIADWYTLEWGIPRQKTMERLSVLKADSLPFQILMSVDYKPIATGGAYLYAGLVDIEPRFKVYENWLVLIYTKVEERGKGYGSILCEEIEKCAKQLGFTDMYLFTYTAEKLYKHLGWQELERLTLNNKEMVVMKKQL
jgi:GNAT superfamily N-acetyltransferase